MKKAQAIPAKGTRTSSTFRLITVVMAFIVGFASSLSAQQKGQWAPGRSRPLTPACFPILESPMPIWR